MCHTKLLVHFELQALQVSMRTENTILISGNSIAFGEEIRILGFFNAHDIWSTDASDLSQHNKTIK